MTLVNSPISMHTRAYESEWRSDICVRESNENDEMEVINSNYNKPVEFFFIIIIF